MGRRKRLLREKRKAKHQKVAMAAFKYHVETKVKEYMAKHGDMYLKRLMKTVSQKNPLAVAIVAYQAFRDSPLAKDLKKIDKKSYDSAVIEAIMSMAIILDRLGWEMSEIEKFTVHSKELAGIK